MPGIPSVSNKQTAAQNNLIIIYLNSIFFAALVIAAVILYKPAEAYLHTTLTGFRDTLISKAEQTLNRTISYGSMRTTFFNVLDIKNITICAAQSGEELLSASRIRVSWSIKDILILLMKKKMASLGASVHVVRIDTPVINVDLEKDADIIKLITGLAQEGEVPSLKDVLNENAALVIKNGTARVAASNSASKTPLTGDSENTGGSNTGAFTLAVSGLYADTRIRNNRLFFGGHCEAALTSSEIDRLFNRPLPVSVTAALNGSSSLDFTDIAAGLTVASFSTPLFDSAPLRFNLQRDHDALTLTSAQERFPFDVSLEGDLAAGSFSVTALAEDFSPEDIVVLNGELKPYQKWLEMTLSGAASLFVEKSGAFRYTVALAGGIPAYLPIGSASFSINGSGDASSIRLQTLSVQTKQGKFGFSGWLGFTPVSPSGTITVSGFTLSKKARADARLNIATHGRTVQLSGDSIELGDVSLVSPAASIYVGDRGLNWSLSINEVRRKHTPEAAWGDSALAGERQPDTEHQDMRTMPVVSGARILVEGAFDYRPQNVEIRLALNDVTVADIAEMATPFIAMPDASGQAASAIREVAINTEIFITTNFVHLLYNAPELILRYRNILAHISLAGTDRRIEIYKGYVDWGAGSLEALLYADFMNIRNIPFGATVSYKNTLYSVEGLFLEGNTVTIQGSYGLNASVAMSGGGFAGFLEMDGVPLPAGEAVSYISVNSSFHFESPEAWGVNILSLNLSNIATPASPSSTIRLSGTMDQDHAELPLIFFDDGMALTGNVSLLWDRAFSSVSGVIAFRNEDGGEQYYVELSCSNVLGNGAENPRYTVWLTGSGMRLAHFLERDYKTVISGNARLDWESIDAFSASATIDSLDAVLSDTAVHLTGTATADNETVIVSGIQARYGGLRGDIPSFTADLDSATMPRIQFNGNIAGKAFTLDCGIEAAYGRIASWRDIAHVADAFSGTILVNTIRLDALQSAAPFEFDFSHKDELISLFGGPEGMFRFQISDRGDFFADLAAPSPVRGTVTGVIAGSAIDAVASDIYVDLTSLWRFLPPQKDVIVAGGFVTASIEIRGPLTAPEFFGQAIGESVALQVPQYLKHDIRPVPITVTLTGTEMTFGPIPAAVGHGAGIVSGWFRFDRWVPATFTLNITAPASTPIPFAFDLMGIVAQGDATGTLRLAMEDNVFRTIGDLTAQDTVVTLNFEELENQPEPAAPDGTVSFVTDIIVRSGRKLEFLWPTEAFPIIQASADLGASLKIENDTSTGSLLLLGDIPLRSGEVFYFERSFYLQEGTLSFNENEIRFDPHIAARAESRDRTDDGPVIISLIIDKSPLSSFTTRLESNPALSQVEIFSLLGQNMTGSSSGDASSAMQNLLFSSSADILSQLWVIRYAERKIRDWLHLDMFSFRTPIAQNAMSMLIRNQSQSADMDQSNSAQRTNDGGNYFDNTTVFLGKYISSNMFVQGMFSLRDEVGQNIEGVTLDFDLGIELKTPLFNVRWNFAPTLDQTMLNPRSLFIDDMSFTLTWRKSF
ncbi:MAG: translocation/assembly module TamB [Treponema sp.]|jgi:hypothetical protein|nr:translocation/assembly module TamB [Treponema sp.]